MKKRMYILALAAIAAAAGLTAVGLGDQTHPKPGRWNAAIEGGAAPLPKPSVKEAQEAAKRPVFAEKTQVVVPSFHVSPSPHSRGEELELQTKAARLLTKANPTPAHRLRHFRWLGDRRVFQIAEWNGSLERLDPVPGGYVATIRVSPSITFHNCSATTIDYTWEKYSLANGQIEFLDGIDPPDASPAYVTD